MRMMSVNPPRNPVTQVQATINVEKTGAQLKLITKEKGYEVKDLMTLTGYSSQAVYKWFNGKSLPSIDTFVVLSQALNMNINELLVIDGEFDFFACVWIGACVGTGFNTTQKGEHRATAGSMTVRLAGATMKTAMGIGAVTHAAIRTVKRVRVNEKGGRSELK